MVFTEIFDFIKNLYTEKKETIFTVLIVAVICFVCYFLYGQLIREQDTSEKDLVALKEQQSVEIKKIREYQVDAEIQFQQEISNCHRECRQKIDSLEQFYYDKFKSLKNSIQRIENKVNIITQ